MPAKAAEPEQHGADRPADRGRAAATRVPAQRQADREEDGRLQQLDGDDRDDLGPEQAGAARAAWRPAA